MTEPFKPSTRLKKIALHIKEDAIFADIGSDHAYLPCFVCLQNPSIYAIAGEVQDGPYQNAKHTVEKQELTSRIDVRLGDGLEVLGEGDKVDTIVIAGMGGQLIADILNKGKEKLSTVQTIITQPNTNPPIVRQFLYEAGYHLTEEHILKENGIIYEILIAKQSASNPYYEAYHKQLYFGPFLLQEQSAIFLEKWEQELLHLEQIYQRMNQAVHIDTVKLVDLERKISWIKEVIR